MAVPLQSDVPTFQAPPGERLEFVPRQIVVRVHEAALRAPASRASSSSGAVTDSASRASRSACSWTRTTICPGMNSRRRSAGS